MTNSNEFRRTSGLSPEYALLGFLERSPAHGYELHQKLLEHLGEIWHASLSQTYNILTRLEEQGGYSRNNEGTRETPRQTPLPFDRGRKKTF